MTFRRVLMHALTPFSKLLGDLHIAPSHRRCKAKHFRDIFNSASPGDVLLSVMRGELNNLCIPGYWSHAALYVGNGVVVEAVGDGVVESDLIDFVLSKDNVCLLRLKENRGAECACSVAQSMVGRPYDFYFEPGDLSFYCSELVWYSWNEASLKVTGKPINFSKRTTLGVATVVPQDYRNASSKFDVVYQCFSEEV
jgi:uncharacterized protein YycO